MTTDLFAAGPRGDDDDPLTLDTPDGVLWTRVNVGEALPGVTTPISWSFYGDLLESAARRGFADLGIIPASATTCPARAQDRMFGVFSGYFVANVGVVRAVMSGLPGVSGDDIERDMLGSVREGVQDTSFGWRLPSIAARMPVRLFGAGRTATRCREDYGRWWASRVDRSGLIGPGTPREALAEAAQRFYHALRLQARSRLLYSGATSGLADLTERAGRPDLTARLLAGAGAIEETIVADDLWALSQEELDLEIFLRRHGYHGPTAGAVESRSWREDPAPVQRLLPNLRETEHPNVRRAPVSEQRRRAVDELLAALPRRNHPAARMVLRMTPFAGMALQRTKTAFLMSLDVARAATRAIGADLVAADRLGDPEGAMQLFLDELLDPSPGDQRGRVERRTAARKRYESLAVPETWEGAAPVTPRADIAERPPVEHLSGLGVAAGIAEGRARVVLDPAEDVDIDTGDILVCHTTDPSWVSLMTLAGGLVIDIGGAASHGAVVARELGIPCVIGTHTGTVDLVDESYVRIDGSAGTVEVRRA